MTNALTGAAIAAALTLTGLSAHASCADARTAGQPGAQHVAAPQNLSRPAAARFFGDEGAGERIVGTWHVTYTVEGNYFADAFMQWHSDGTEWENINLPVLGGTLCMGEWKALDRARVSRNHIGWLYNNGTVVGYFTETETDVVARDGNSYTGTNDQKIYDLKGTMLAEVTGTSSATRVGQ